MSDKVFVVIKEGVYRHNIHGIFSTLKTAVSCAVEICRKDKDDYHEYAIYESRINEPSEDVVTVAWVKRNDPWKNKYGQSVDQTKWLRVFHMDGTVIDLERSEQCLKMSIK